MNSRFYVEQGDCMELMAKLPDHSVDFLLTDPPYGITNFKWDKPQDWGRFWREAKRVCKPNAAMALFASGRFAIQLPMSNFKDYRYKYVWDKWLKGGGTGFLSAKKRPLIAHEELQLFYAKQPTYNPQLRDDPSKKARICRDADVVGPYNRGRLKGEHGVAGKRYPTDILRFSVMPCSLRRHGTQKPLSLLEFLIKTYSNEGETVLDPFMGSGSTGRAALNCNRRFIGFELDPDYFASAKDWLKPQYDTNEKRPK